MKTQEIRILHLEDVPSDSQLAEREIKKVLNQYILHVVERKEEFLDELNRFRPHIVISDYMLPTFDGMSALKIVLEKAPLTPVIILTGSMNEDTAVDCMKAGATDYVIKGHIKRLGPAVLNALEQYEIKLAKKQAEVALLQSEQNFRRSISESPLGIRIVSDKGQTVYANDMFLKMHGFANIEELRNTPDEKHLTTESLKEHQEREEKRKNGDLENEYEISIWDNKQEIKYIKVWNKEILWNGTKHFQVIHQDVTGQRQLTNDLIAAKLKAEEGERLKTSFLQNISHEIRTPMNAIVGFSELLNSQELSPEKQKQFTGIIVNSSNQLLSIITDIVKIASIESGHEVFMEKNVNLPLLISHIYYQYSDKANKLNLNFNHGYELDGATPIVITDETKLRNILTHLLDNAFKFTSSGSVDLGFVVKGANVEFYVKDTGVGIAVDKIEDIFKRFRKIEDNKKKLFGGSGLGLSISKAYVELLGGKIWAESEICKGSTFYFTIPLKQEKRAETEVKPVVSTSSVGKYNFSKTILIAEDDDTNYFVLEEMLSELEFNIIRAINGLEAVEICRTFPVDIILMDIKMPDMDGFEATQRIREFMPKVPIIAQTAFSEREDISQSGNFGCNDVVSKPIILSVLLRKINEQLCKSEKVIN